MAIFKKYLSKPVIEQFLEIPDGISMNEYHIMIDRQPKKYFVGNQPRESIPYFVAVYKLVGRSLNGLPIFEFSHIE